jgi:hypothetical protein
MKKSITILIFIFLFKISSAQDTLKRFEFGSTLVTSGKYNLGYSPPTFQYINGLFFRFTKKRIGLRLHASYSDNTTSYTSNSNSSLYFFGETTNNKDLKLGVGGQFSILNRKDWFYSFLDISYRKIFSTGFAFGFNDENFTSTTNGIDSFVGIGFKIKAITNFYLSPEIGCYTSSQFVEKTTTSANIYNSTTGQLASHKDSYSFTDVSPVFKLHLTIKFQHREELRRHFK